MRFHLLSLYNTENILFLQHRGFSKVKKKFKIAVFKSFSIMLQGGPGRHHYPWKMHKLKNKHWFGRSYNLIYFILY